MRQMESGKTLKQLEQEQRALAKSRAKKPGKEFGECDSCGLETVLVEEIGMCGPCTFGEADTANGNW